MFSSIHTIHRPVAHSKRSKITRTLRVQPAILDALEGVDESSLPPGLPERTDRSAHETAALVMEGTGREHEARVNAQTRSASMATVRMKRRAGLADKLRDVFELPGITEVIAGKYLDNWRVYMLMVGSRVALLAFPLHQ
jgi:sterol 3beta-glucosyltransferase